MPTHHLTAFSAAPPERVFALWTDLDRMKEWVGGVTKVTDRTGPVTQPGTRYVVWFGPVKSPTVVLEADRPRRFSTRFGSWILRGTNTTTFEPEGAGTRISEVLLALLKVYARDQSVLIEILRLLVPFFQPVGFVFIKR